jgi:hypothetical protein
MLLKEATRHGWVTCLSYHHYVCSKKDLTLLSELVAFIYETGDPDLHVRREYAHSTAVDSEGASPAVPATPVRDIRRNEQSNPFGLPTSPWPIIRLIAVLSTESHTGDSMARCAVVESQYGITTTWVVTGQM